MIQLIQLCCYIFNLKQKFTSLSGSLPCSRRSIKKNPMPQTHSFTLLNTEKCEVKCNRKPWDTGSNLTPQGIGPAVRLVETTI